MVDDFRRLLPIRDFLNAIAFSLDLHGIFRDLNGILWDFAQILWDFFATILVIVCLPNMNAFDEGVSEGSLGSPRDLHGILWDFAQILWDFFANILVIVCLPNHNPCLPNMNALDGGVLDGSLGSPRDLWGFPGDSLCASNRSI